jgi:dihydroorotate dehydrogenase (NAD+) catalytic subunit
VFKTDLTLRKHLMNAAGILGFAPDPRVPISWDSFGAFVTNPLSLHPRLPAANPAMMNYPGGFLLHTGLPNPGLPAAIKKYASRWAKADMPIIVHLMADRAEETVRMIRMLEGLENIFAVELGFAAGLADDIVVLVVERAMGELPLIVSLPWVQVMTLGYRVKQAGAAAVSLTAARGALPGHDSLITGRLYGASLFPPVLDVVEKSVRLGLPVIGGGGVYSRENVAALLSVGALAVQVDTVLWRGWP